ncbi:helix-turn-helix domain-containing protein [Kerstersia similis]|uniref:helix-turn-helix domain-containing protein n=1 Tax=Kerstersia similis TaxID=206505 RepID=UPI0039EF2636
MSFPQRLASMMRRRGIRSQNQLARLCGVSQSSIHRMLYLDGYAPKLATLKKIALALDTSVAWLMDGDITAAQHPAPGRPVLQGDILRIVMLLHSLPQAHQQRIWQSLSRMAAEACQEDTGTEHL